MALGLLLFAASGCSTNPQVAKRAPDQGPHVVGLDEIMQQQAAQARKRELIKAGKSPEEARRTAEKEYPAPPPDSAGSLQSADYYRWQKQKAAQEKFESDLDKLNRKS